MTIIDQPIPDTAGEVTTPDGKAIVLPYQLVVLVSLASWKTTELPPNAPRFPAILDTGNNHNFAIRRDQLDRWAGLAIPRRGEVRVGGRTIPLLASNVWIHRSPTGTPFKLELPEGIAVYPSDVTNPARLPILGLRGLVRNKLTLVIDGKKQGVTLEEPS